MTTSPLPPGLDLEGVPVLVIGLQETGRAVATVLAQRGARVLASDSGTPDTDEFVALGIDVETGGHARASAALGEVAFLVPSPGVKPSAPILADARRRGVPVVSELDLGMRLAEGAVIAVTGTNGKTTVCRLAELIGRAAGLDAYACGNLETKFVTAAAEHPSADVFVVEASSFALAYCEIFHPRTAVVTNIAPDHLDWHADVDDYRAAKARIAARQGTGDTFIYPAVQPELADMAPAGVARLGVGADGDGDVAFVAGDEVVVRIDGREWRAPGAGRLTDRGGHFGNNAAAAVAAMVGVGADEEAITRGLEGFTFDEHRLAPIGTKDDVRVIDDSVSANPHATRAALRTFDDPVVLIAGGRPKSDLRPLAEEAGSLRAVVAIGEAADELRDVFEPTGVIVGIASSMPEAVAMAFERARPGDVVLLSPACASFDMFSGYADRGRAFREACAAVGVRP